METNTWPDRSYSVNSTEPGRSPPLNPSRKCARFTTRRTCSPASCPPRLIVRRHHQTCQCPSCAGSTSSTASREEWAMVANSCSIFFATRDWENGINHLRRVPIRTFRSITTPPEESFTKPFPVCFRGCRLPIGAQKPYLNPAVQHFIRKSLLFDQIFTSSSHFGFIPPPAPQRRRQARDAMPAVPFARCAGHNVPQSPP